MNIQRKFNRTVVLRDLRADLSTEDLRAILAECSTSEEVTAKILGWRELDLEFLGSCSPDLFFMQPKVGPTDDIISLWCQEECQLPNGKLNTFRQWWFQSESEADAFGKIWCYGEGPGRAWKRKHDVSTLDCRFR